MVCLKNLIFERLLLSGHHIRKPIIRLFELFLEQMLLLIIDSSYVPISLFLRSEFIPRSQEWYRRFYKLYFWFVVNVVYNNGNRGRYCTQTKLSIQTYHDYNKSHIHRSVQSCLLIFNLFWNVWNYRKWIFVLFS